MTVYTSWSLYASLGSSSTTCFKAVSIVLDVKIVDHDAIYNTWTLNKSTHSVVIYDSTGPWL